MITYRKATINDIESLIKLRLDFLAEYNKRQLTIEESEILTRNLSGYFRNALLENRFIAWLALDGNRIVATSGTTFYELPPRLKVPTGKIAYIMNMYTKPEFRRQGIAGILFDKLVQEIKALGYKKISLHASEMGYGIYKRYGFREPSDKEMILYV